MKNRIKIKRIISIALCVILSLSSLTSSFAVAEWPNAGAINLTKTATPVEGVDNQWDITLTIEGKNITTTSDVVFVIDTSGSMNDNNKLSTMKTGVKNAINSIMKDSAVRVAYVTFAQTASKSSFYDYSKKTNLTSAIDKITATGGTNIQAGLKAARELLATSTADNKYVIVVGDGEPTYSYKVAGLNYKDTCTSKEVTTKEWSWEKFKYIDMTTTEWTHSLELTKVVSVNYDKQVGTGSSFDLSSSDCYTVNCSHGSALKVVSTNGPATTYEADLVKATGAKVFTMAVSAGTNGEAVLKACASGDDYYFNATASNMSEKLATIASHIKYAATVNAGMGVTDPMGEYFDLVGEIKVSQGSYTYDAKTETISWLTGNIVEGTPATMTYRVTVDPNKVSQMDPGTAYPTNKTTTFKYIDVEGKETSKDFVVPKVSISKGTIVVNGYLVNEAGQPINSEGVVVEGPQYAAKVFEPYNVKENDKTALEYKAYTINPDKYLESSYEYVNYVIVDGNVKGNASSFDVTVTKKVPSQVVYVGYKKVSTADYTIEYYKGSVNGTKLGTDVKTGTIGSNISLTGEQLSAFAPIGYVTPGVIADGSSTKVDIDSTKNVVKVVYTTKAVYNYTINYYKDSISTENKLGDSVVKSAEYGQRIVPTTNEFNARLPEGYKIPATIDVLTVSEIAENNVINIVYAKDSFGYKVEYYIDSISNGIRIGVATVKAAEFKSAISVNLTLYAPTGYTTPGTVAEGSLEVLADNSQVIKVLYVKDNFGYTINYYTDEVDANNLITSKSDSAEFDSVINVPDLETLPEGYTKEGKVVTGTSIVTAVTEDNVVNVVYKRASFEYTINYYADSVDGTLLETIKDTAKYGSSVEVLLTGYAPVGYIAEGTVVNGNLTDGKLTINTTGNVVDVVYTKNSFDYTINYYADFVSEDTLVWSIADTAAFGSLVDVALVGFAPVGYKTLGTVENGTLTDGKLQINVSGNVVDIVYEIGAFDYVVNYYQDSVSEDNYIDSVSGTVDFGSLVDVALEGFAPVGYNSLGTVVNGTLVNGKIEISVSGNVVDIVYTKNTFSYTIKYYKDSIEEKNILGVDEESAEYGSEITVDDTKNAPTGYTKPGIVDGTLVVTADNSQVITVLYSTKNIYNYTINYYADSISAENKIGDSVIRSAEYGESINLTNAEISARLLNGYKLPESVNNITVTEIASNNIINVVYTKDSYVYTVEYYQDSILSENKLDEVVNTAEYDSNISVDLSQFAPVGYVTPGTVVSGELKVLADNSQVIKVLYVKDNFGYTINYYTDEVNVDNLITSATNTAEFGSVIIVPELDTLPTGYTAQGKEISGATIVTEVTANNVVNVVYKRDSFGYTINYYSDEVSTDNLLNYVAKTAEFGSSVDVALEGFAPEGYKAEGTVVNGTLTEGKLVIEAEGNVIDIVYTKDMFGYTINYYTDEVADANLVGTVEDVAEFGSTIDVDATLFAPEGYITPGTVLDGVKTVTVEGTVINVVYEAEEVEEITTDPTPLDNGDEDETTEEVTTEEITTEEVTTEEVTSEETTEEESTEETTSEEEEALDIDEIPLDNGPKTGDSTNWIILLGLAMISAGVVGVVTKKKKIED